ncbi:MAG: tripartite tricarboxylate transporter permease [Pseudomonadota bacterium]
MFDFTAILMNPALPVLLALITAGVLTGFVVGAMPGFDITTGVALLLPLSYLMGQSEALAFFTAMYCAGVFGGSITAILFRIPGTSESVMSAVEGHPFTARGEPGLALGVAIVCSGVAGVAATLVLMTVSPLLAAFALAFAPGDYAALGLLGCAAVVSASGDHAAKGLIAILLGLFLSTVGPDQISGDFRFTVAPALQDGIGLIPAIIGLFAVADVFWRILTNDIPSVDRAALSQKWRFPTIGYYLKLTGTVIRAWTIGLFTGVLPGAGASSAAFIAHSAEARFSRNADKFGSGAPEALAAPETAKNAAAVGSLIPLLALGIPGSGTAAVILGAFEIHNLQAGPLLFAQEPELVQTIFFAAIIANIAFVLASFVLMRPIAMMTSLPYPILATGILTLAITGGIATGGLSGAYIMLGFAMLGVALKFLDIPAAPVVLGIVLGPIIEVYFRRGLLMTDGDVGAVFASPMSIGLLSVAALFLALPVISPLLAKGTKPMPKAEK